MLKTGEAKLNEMVEVGKRAGDSPSSPSSREGAGDRVLPPGAADAAEAERFLSEINRLRRKVALLEDAVDGDIEEHQGEVGLLPTLPAHASSLRLGLGCENQSGSGDL
jgi:hypothetical protein